MFAWFKKNSCYVAIPWFCPYTVCKYEMKLVIIFSGVSATPTSISPAAAAALTNAVASVTTTPSLSPASTPVDTSKAPNIDTATPTVPSSSTTSHDKENASNDEKDTAGMQLIHASCQWGSIRPPMPVDTV